MSADNEALWLDSAQAAFRVGPAPYLRPGGREIVIAARAVAVNPVDTLPGIARRFVYPWLRYPAVLGTDVAGDIVEIGPDVTRFRVGDQVVGLATGQERFRNSPAHGAFQRYVVLDAQLTTPVPPAMAMTDAVVLPLAAITAAAGLFQPDHLGLALPSSGARQPDQTVLVWGGSTSVGSNAIQLAQNAGYHVIATASRRNHDYLRSLGADAAFDYHDPDIVPQLVRALQGHHLVGTVAIGAGSLARAIRIARSAEGTRRVASAYPTPATSLRKMTARTVGIHVSAIWGGSPAQNDIGPAVFADFLPTALADGRYQPAPPAHIIGHGLTEVPEALATLRAGVSARKLVIEL